MNIKQIEYVLAIWKYGSISKAAKGLYVSQPSLSQYIHNLEDQLGMKLFDRGTTPLQLTDAGRIYVRYASEIMDCYNKLGKELKELSAKEAVRISISAPSYFIFHLMAPIISEFKRNFPSVSISMTDMPQQQRQQALLSEEIDILFTSRRTNDSRLNFKYVLSERVILALPPTHRLVTPEMLKYQEEVALPAIRSRNYQKDTPPFANDLPSISLMELRDDSFIMTKAYGNLSQSVIDLCRQIGFQPRIGMNNVNIESALTFAVEGIGIAFIPETILRFSKTEKQPVYFCIDQNPLIRDIYIGYNKSRQECHEIDEFINTSIRVLTS